MVRTESRGSSPTLPILEVPDEKCLMLCPLTMILALMIRQGAFRHWKLEPNVSTKREAEFEEGFTATGRAIMRYQAFFTPNEKKKAEGKKPRYQVLTFEEPKDGKPAEWRLESGSNVGEDAVEAYVNSSSSMKINEYYGEKHMGITYTKEFFEKYHTEFLWALRKDDHTKSSRTLPPERCILGFDYNGKQWWDVFSRSAYGTFWGKKRAGIRIDQWHIARGEKPSYRLPLEGEKSSDKSSMSQTSGSNSSGIRDDILKAVDTKMDTMRTDFQKSLDSISQAITSLTELIGELTRRQVSPIAS